ncbi:MAG: hypothetical protein C0592_12210 [Marinilabiliales bacterium]|nr:MAG: hypothetical protein C0592_12210 [Marinilabiliales bacterium]
MKKSLLFVFMCLALLTVQAQNEVIIGTGVSSTHDSGPIYVSSAASTYYYSNHISLFTPAEIGASNIPLTGFSWDKADTDSYTLGNAEFRIYVKHTSASSVPAASGTFATELVGATLVYESTTQNIPATSGWIDFNFNTGNQFIYNGTDNLMVLVDWYRPGAPSAGISWYYTTTTGMAQTWAQDITPPTYSYGTDDRPNTKIRYLASPTVTPNPALITCGDTVVFTASGGTGIYNWYNDSLGNSFIGSDSVLSVGPLCNDATVYVGTVYYETYNFTNCGVTGRTGPTQNDVNTAYSGTNLYGFVTITTQGIQEWTVPTSGTYKIEVAGAQGGGTNGGLGANMQGEFSFTAGETLKILVGQEGEALTGSRYDYSGGGGSFVTTSTNTPLIIAGGGGGAEIAGVGSAGQVGTSGNDGTGGYSSGIGGTAGNGGTYDNQTTDGGAGLLTDGGSGNPNPAPQAFIDGGEGGSNSWSSPSALGGFGGGGASCRDNITYHGAGGGGGYSGGGSDYGQAASAPIAGGGGSYNSGTNQNNTAGANTGHGYVTITLISDSTISALTPAQINVAQIDDPVVSSPVSVCEDDSIALSASGSTGNFYWYADSLGTLYLGEGSSYQTGPLTSDTTLYVQAFSDSIDIEYIFTTCGDTGVTGPTLTEIEAAYSLSVLNGNVDVTAQGIQQWIVPYTGVYTIEVAGAQGYGPYGGRGANMIGDFSLTAGDTLKILVGQKAEDPVGSSNQYGGGGGTFITYFDNTPLIIAGGGGGSWATSFTATTDATTATSGNSGANGDYIGAGGTGGNGGTDASSADGGGGLLGDGGGDTGGKAFINGGYGGVERGYGGYGGGGGTSSWDNRRGGGGGGYSGGGGARSNSSTAGNPEGGGGGSYNAGTNQVNTAGINTGHGYVIITVNAPLCVSDLVPIEINVNEIADVTVQPVDVATTQGDNAIFTITATGAGLTYQWQESTDSAATWSDLSETAPYSGVTTSTLTITGITPTVNNNYYRCLVSGTCGADTSDVGILTITDVGIDDYTLSSTSIYPNPVSDILIVEVDNRESDHIQISVFDMVGKLVIQFPQEDLQQGTNTFQYNVEALADGVYYVEVRVDMLRKLHKLIKE